MTKRLETDQAAPRKRLPRESTPKRSAARGMATAGPDGGGRKASGGSASRDDIFKIVERVPKVGPLLVYIVKKWGVPGLLLFLTGAVSASGLVWFGVYPSWLVSEKFKQPATSAPAPPRTSVRSIDFEALPEEELEQLDWVQLYSNSFENEAELKKRDGHPADLQYGVEAFKYDVEEPTNKFTLLLRPSSPDFKITARVFRQTKGFIQPLNFRPVQDGIPQEGDLFTIPECDAGDRLILIVRSEWTRDILFEGVKTTFSSSIAR